MVFAQNLRMSRRIGLMLFTLIKTGCMLFTHGLLVWVVPSAVWVRAYIYLVANWFMKTIDVHPTHSFISKIFGHGWKDNLWLEIHKYITKSWNIFCLETLHLTDKSKSEVEIDWIFHLVTHEASMSSHNYFPTLYLFFFICFDKYWENLKKS